MPQMTCTSCSRCTETQYKEKNVKKKILQTHSASKVISNLSYSKTNRQGKALSTPQHTLPDPMQVSRHEGKSNKALALIQKESTGTRCEDRNQVRACCK